MISYKDPIPVDIAPGVAEQPTDVTPPTPGELQRFETPYDWAAIDHTVRTSGGAILEGTGDFRRLAGGVARLSGAVDMSQLSANIITFNCIFVLSHD